MRRLTLLSAFMILVMALVACTPAATPTAAPTTMPSDTDTPAVVMTDTSAATEAATDTAEAPTEVATSTAGTTGTITAATSLMTSTNASVAEPFLVDDQGRSVYVFANDTQNSGTSACTDEECTKEWPAVVVTAAPTAGEGADSAMIGTITREDGTMQATYNGWPLYYSSGDANPGDINGQGMEGLWHLISATGNPIR